MATKGKQTFVDFMKAFMRSAKAVPETEFENFVEDYTDDEHRVPGGEQIPFGPAQAASGEGAVRMIREYSDPAKQQAITEEYIRFNRHIDKRLGAVGKALTEQGKTLAAITTYLSKGATDEGEGTGDTLIEKAQTSLKKARKIIGKSEVDEDEDKDERAENLERAEKALSVAKAAILKAEDEDEDEEEVEKARSLLKSLTKRVKDLHASIKAAEGHNQAPKEDPETGNQDAAAAKALETAIAATLEKLGVVKAETEVEKAQREKDEVAKAEAAAKAAAAATTGDAVGKAALQAALEPINMSLKSLFEVLAGQSKGLAVPPSLQKSDLNALVKARMDKVQDALDNEELSELDSQRALNIVSHLRAAQEGKMDMSVALGEIAKSSGAVQSLFSVAA